MNTYQAALYTQRPLIGRTNPVGEVSYEGYARVKFLATTVNLGPIEFDVEPPHHIAKTIVCIAILDASNQVVAIKDVGGVPLILPN